MAERYLSTTEEIKREATRLGGWRPEVFDDWLASHDAEVRAQALRDAQSDLKDERDDLASAIERVRALALGMLTDCEDGFSDSHEVRHYATDLLDAIRQDVEDDRDEARR